MLKSAAAVVLCLFFTVAGARAETIINGVNAQLMAAAFNEVGLSPVIEFNRGDSFGVSGIYKGRKFVVLGTNCQGGVCNVLLYNTWINLPRPINGAELNAISGGVGMANVYFDVNETQLEMTWATNTIGGITLGHLGADMGMFVGLMDQFWAVASDVINRGS